MEDPLQWDDVAPYSEGVKALWRQWDRLRIMDRVLARQFMDTSSRTCHWQIVMPLALRTEFISALHESVAGGHFRRNRTELAEKARAYWPGWAGDVRRVLRTCESCARYLMGKPPRQVQLKPIICGEPLELLISTSQAYILLAFTDLCSSLLCRTCSPNALIRCGLPLIIRNVME